MIFPLQVDIPGKKYQRKSLLQLLHKKLYNGSLNLFFFLMVLWFFCVFGFGCYTNFWFSIYKRIVRF
jgi:hypothetical protein